MIKVTVMYPHREGARFDHRYYRDRHMPMMKAKLGAACVYYTVDRGVSGREPDSAPAFVAMCAFHCSSAEAYRAASKAHRAEILADIGNYTDITPLVVISEIVVDRSSEASVPGEQP